MAQDEGQMNMQACSPDSWRRGKKEKRFQLLNLSPLKRTGGIKVKKENCIFCKIAAGEVPSKTLYEDEQFRVILDLAPATKGHALIIPKEHYANLYEIPHETAAGVMKLAKTMAATMTERLGAEGFNLLQNNGETAGQTVMHFHMHLIPRYKGDGQQLFHEQPTASQEELEEIKRKITE